MVRDHLPGSRLTVWMTKKRMMRNEKRIWAKMSVIAMLQQRHSRSCSRPSPAGVSFVGIAAYGVISNTDPNVVLVSPSVVP
jgi:hypothetical protein